MRGIVISILLVSFQLAAIGQKCVPKKDHFSNSESCEFESNINYFSLKSLSNDSIKFIYSKKFSGSNDLIIPKNSILKVKLSSGDIIELITKSDAMPKLNSAYDYKSQIHVFSEYRLEFILSKIELEKLAAYELYALRIPSPEGGTADMDISEKSYKSHFKELQKGFNCLIDCLQ